jgi:predicted transcriptional regulator
MYHWVGRAIQDVRAALIASDAAFTQEHVAHEAGVSLRHYQKIEAGTIEVRVSTLFQIAEVLKKKPQQLLDRADDLHRIGATQRARKR